MNDEGFAAPTCFSRRDEITVMPYPLIGLDSTLSDEQCNCVTLWSSPGDAATVYTREGEDGWCLDDGGSDPLHTQELLQLIRDAFGKTCNRVECALDGESVGYAIERGSVKIKRGARQSAAPEPEPADFDNLVNALGIPKSKRKAKLKQALQFGRIVRRALPQKDDPELRVLDLACGRSYLGFVLSHMLDAHGHKVQLHGVDSNEVLVDKCRRIAETLGWTNATFEMADLSGHSVAPDAYDVMVSLHGCDTLTDDAIRIAHEGRVPLLFLAPCCQHELRHLWKAHPLQWISRYGLLEQRLADVITDGFRCLVLEALGYKVNVLRFTAPDVTPKNLLIQARLSSGPRPGRAADARAFLRQFRVRPRLAAVLEAAGLAGDGH